jgi:hypothetical protein
MKALILLTLAVSTTCPHYSGAATPPKGTPMCQGAGCQFEEVPLGTTPKIESTAPTPTTKAAPSITKKSNPAPDSNLPPYYRNVDRSAFSASEKAVYATPPKGNKLPGVEPGDTFKAVLQQSIKASPSVPTPVRAVITSGIMTGHFAMGTATLDKELKRILITFSKLRSLSGGSYDIYATALSEDGRVGIEGDYHTENDKFFVSELAASTAAAMADSTIQRQQTPLGGWVQEPSFANHVKQGAVAALSKTSSRIADAARSAPEWTEIGQYQNIQIIFEDDQNGGTK